MAMPPPRKQRLIRILFLLAGVGITTLLALLALRDNLDFFYSPEAIVAGAAPLEKRIRVGGMVLAGSLQRAPDSLAIRFVLSDLQGARVQVHYVGILPDLFREGQGVVALGALGRNGVFQATEILAKHDENYMPPEVADMLKELPSSTDAAHN